MSTTNPTYAPGTGYWSEGRTNINNNLKLS